MVLVPPPSMVVSLVMFTTRVLVEGREKSRRAGSVWGNSLPWYVTSSQTDQNLTRADLGRRSGYMDPGPMEGVGTWT